MQVNLTGQNIDITPALRRYVLSKLERIKRHFDHVIDVHIVLKVLKLEQHVEATINTRGKSLFAKAKSSDMYAAIDALVDKLDRQAIKYKEKITDHHHGAPHKNLFID